MKILHIIRHMGDSRALDTARAHQRQGHQVTLLLMQDAVLSRVRFAGEVVACQEDVSARTGRTRLSTVDYDGIVRMVFEHDRVISW